MSLKYGNNLKPLPNQTINPYKQKQLDMILKHNPADPKLGNSTWVRQIDDIKTYEEAWEDSDWKEYFDEHPQAKDIIKSGMVKVFSSYPIKEGIFVTPNEQEAKSYAGGKTPYSKLVPTKHIAWLDPEQGQYTPLDD